MHIQLKEIMQAVLSRFDGWLYNSALTKIIYLVDVEAVNRLGRQVTDTQWQRDSYGPFVWDIIDCAGKEDSIFEIRPEGWNKRRIHLRESHRQALPLDMPMDVETIIDDVISECPNPKTNFKAFKEYVYRTAPMLLSRGNGPLDLLGASQAAEIVDGLTESLFHDTEWNEAFEYLAAN